MAELAKLTELTELAELAELTKLVELTEHRWTKCHIAVLSMCALELTQLIGSTKDGTYSDIRPPIVWQF